jgi:two-component system chemotaxis response regulator CheB
MSAPRPRRGGRVQAVVIGMSAGGLDALSQILRDLPESFGPPLIVVQHLPENHPSQIVEIFQRLCALQVEEARDKDRPRPGHLYFAPPGYHLLVEMDRSFSLSVDPRVHYARPSIDVLFDSAADVWGAQLAGILLTGANSDGAEGLQRIARQGGLTVVQEPTEALADSMPRAALKLFQPDHVLPLAGIRQLLLRMDR